MLVKCAETRPLHRLRRGVLRTARPTAAFRGARPSPVAPLGVSPHGSSPSDKMTVAVGFSPRSPAIGKSVAERRLKCATRSCVAPRPSRLLQSEFCPTGSARHLWSERSKGFLPLPRGEGRREEEQNSNKSIKFAFSRAFPLTLNPSLWGEGDQSFRVRVYRSASHYSRTPTRRRQCALP